MPAFIFVVKTDNTGTSDDDQFTIPSASFSTEYNYTVTKISGPGDLVGDPVSHTTANTALTLTFTEVGTYELAINGTFRGWRFADGGDKLKMLEVKQWGDFQLGNYSGQHFKGCTNLIVTATDSPLYISGSTSAFEMFNGCLNLVDVPNLDTWTITASVAAMFRDCRLFTGATSNIEDLTIPGTNIRTLFFNCESFDRDISNWDVSNITNWGTGAEGFMFNTAGRNAKFSPVNYNAILSKWSRQDLTPSLGIDFGLSQYDIGGDAEQSRFYFSTPVLSQACTFNNSTNIITSAAHGLSDDDVVTFTTTDTLPAELEPNTRYWVINSDTDTFQLSTQKDGSALAFTDNGTGTHTVNGGHGYTLLDDGNTGLTEAPAEPQYIFTNSTPILDGDSNPVEGARVVLMRLDILNDLSAGEINQSDIILGVAVTNSSGNFTINVTGFANFDAEEDYIGVCYKDGDPIQSYIPVKITPVSDEEV